MIARNLANLSALGLMLLAASAYADTKRYLIQFKTAKGFQTFSQNLQSFHVSDFGGPVSTQGRTSVKPLRNIEMLVVQTDDQAMINELKMQAAVERVEEEIMHPAPPQVATWGTMSVGDSGAGRKRLEMPWGIKAVKAPQAWNMTRGQSARVMIIDTGFDAGHPALAGRLEKGRNFIPDQDPRDFSDTIGHGTHVAGTILADGGGDGLFGVAPQARALSAKICTLEGCSSVAMASALDWAVEEHVDVVNMSLGGAMISAAEREALQKAEDNGVMVVAASGNDGVGRVSFPGAVETVLAVGAVNSKLEKAEFSQWGPELDVVAPGVDVYSSVPRGSGRTGVTRVEVNGRMTEPTSALFAGSPMAPEFKAELVFAGLGKEDDLRGIDLRGKIALISRGEIPFREKVANAARNGAAGVIIFNNAPGLAQGTVAGEDGTEASIPAAMIEQSLGESVKAALASGKSVKAVIGVVAYDYSSLQGTSMATPHVSGVAALVRAANRRLTPAQVREIIKSTATALGPNDENQYGSGMVNAEAAVRRAAN